MGQTVVVAVVAVAVDAALVLIACPVTRPISFLSTIHIIYIYKYKLRIDYMTLTVPSSD